ncbi:MAG: hypothetical protein D6698_12795 [Gammaproteobacteria bacterium]|nr:MAG: hypothetical protein D6698_12795 [Gammaproteobacteria bacterium]
MDEKKLPKPFSPTDFVSSLPTMRNDRLFMATSRLRNEPPYVLTLKQVRDARKRFDRLRKKKAKKMDEIKGIYFQAGESSPF